jgi:hypothetical protein
MLTLTIVTILGGAVLGLRYKIFILLPAATFMLVFVIGVDVARGAGIWRIALDMMVAMTALQLGREGRRLPLAPPCNRQRCGCCGTGVRYHPGYSGGVAARDFDAPGLRIGKFDTSPLSCDG